MSLPSSQSLPPLKPRIHQLQQLPPHTSSHFTRCSASSTSPLLQFLQILSFLFKSRHLPVWILSSVVPPLNLANIPSLFFLKSTSTHEIYLHSHLPPYYINICFTSLIGNSFRDFLIIEFSIVHTDSYLPGLLGDINNRCHLRAGRLLYNAHF